MGVNESFENLKQIETKRDEAHYGFIKQLLLMASGTFGILVSLNTSSLKNHNARLLFILSLVLLSLGILFLALALYGQVVVYKSLFALKKEDALLQLQNKHYRSQLIAKRPLKFYDICERIGYISLLSALPCLIAYALYVN